MAATCRLELSGRNASCGLQVPPQKVPITHANTNGLPIETTMRNLARSTGASRESVPHVECPAEIEVGSCGCSPNPPRGPLEQQRTFRHRLVAAAVVGGGSGKAGDELETTSWEPQSSREHG